jgi:MFS family permease
LIMPPIANGLIDRYDWRTSYVVVGVAALVLIALAAQFLRRDPAQMGLLPHGESAVTVNSSVMNQGLALGEALGTRQFWLLGLSLLSFTLGEGSIMVHIVAHARGLGIPAIAASFIITLIGGVSIGGRIIMGTAGDRIGNKTSWIVCLSLVVMSLFWLIVARELWMFYLFAIVFGFGYGGVSVLMSPTVAEYFGLRSHGTIFGMITMFGGTAGMAAGPLIAGHVFDTTGSYFPAFLIYAVSSVIGVTLMLFLAPVRRRSSYD